LALQRPEHSPVNQPRTLILIRQRRHGSMGGVDKLETSRLLQRSGQLADQLLDLWVKKPWHFGDSVEWLSRLQDLGFQEPPTFGARVQ